MAMRRRSSRDRKSVKTPRRSKAPKTVRPRASFATHSESQVDRLTRELQESLAREDATSDVLRVIDSSPTDPKPVFEAILENATRICEAKFGALFLCEGNGL